MYSLNIWLQHLYMTLIAPLNAVALRFGSSSLASTIPMTGGPEFKMWLCDSNHFSVRDYLSCLGSTCHSQSVHQIWV